MNYIKHLNAVFECFAMDIRILPRHISLYMALFQLWNRIKFVNPVSLFREEVMSLSKIGSVNTYIRSLKELDAWGYICYHPSHSPLIGSGVTIITFDTSTGYTTDISSDSTTDNTLFINRYILNNKQLKTELKGQSTKSNDEKKSNNSLPSDTSHKQLKKQFVKPTVNELTAYFQQCNSTAHEATRFFNYFESNGWKVGGKTLIKDWKAAVRNWIINSERFSSKIKKTESVNYL
nr:hypothetical protein [uncultured Carboxylicivirga sp.]